MLRSQFPIPQSHSRSIFQSHWHMRGAKIEGKDVGKGEWGGGGGGGGGGMCRGWLLTKLRWQTCQLALFNRPGPTSLRSEIKVK